MIDDEGLDAVQAESVLDADLGERVDHAIEAALASGAVPAQVVEVVLADATPATTRGASTMTGAALARLLVATEGLRRGDRVLDPAMGEAGVLIAAAATAPELHLTGARSTPPHGT